MPETKIIILPAGERMDARQQYALVILIKEIFQQIDDCAALMRQGHSAQLSRHLLRETCAVLRELEPELEAGYFSTLLKLVDSQSAPRRTSSVSASYVSASEPAKRRFLSFVRDELGLVASG